MKTATRLLLGILSTLLLTAGFARAAEQFDPVSTASVVSSSSLMDPTTLPCAACEDDDNPN